MRKFLGLIAAGLLWAGAAMGYTGTCGIWAMRNSPPDFYSQNFPGTQAGLNAAKTYVGNSGTIQVYPGCSGITVGSLADSVLVMVQSFGGWNIYSGAKVRGASTFNIVGDQTIVDGGLRLEDPGAGTNYLKFLAPTLGGNYSLTFPTANASGYLNNNGAGVLTWGASTTDTTGLVTLLGRTNGQTIFGSNQSSSNSNTVLTLFGYNNTGSSGAAMIQLNQDVKIKASSVLICERGQTVGHLFNTATGSVNEVLTGSMVMKPIAVESGVDMINATGTAPGFYVKAKSSGTAPLFDLYNSSGTTIGGFDHTAGLMIGGGTRIPAAYKGSAALDFDLTASTVHDLTLTVTGAVAGDDCALGVPPGSVTTSVQYTAWVSAANTVTVRARSCTTGENPTSGTFSVTVFKR